MLPSKDLKIDRIRNICACGLAEGVDGGITYKYPYDIKTGNFKQTRHGEPDVGVVHEITSFGNCPWDTY